MVTETGLIPRARMDDLRAIERLRRDTALAVAAAEDEGEDMVKALILAKAMQGLRDLLTPELMQDVMMLAGSQLGFGWDKAYSVEVVRDCVITATLSGFRLATAGGAEWHIIAGKFYAGLKGLQRIVESWPGICDLRIELGVPANCAGGALVPATASWRIGQNWYSLSCLQTKEFDGRIPVRVNAGMGVDGVHGKAKRKMYARILDRLTGLGVSDDAEAEEEGAIVAEVTVADESPNRGGESAAQVIANFREGLAEAEQKTDCYALRDYAHGLLVELGFAADSEEQLIVEVECDDRIKAIGEARGK